jgi:hypothetical protein
MSEGSQEALALGSTGLLEERVVGEVAPAQECGPASPVAVFGGVGALFDLLTKATKEVAVAFD